jgi:hypothetical protein
MPFNTNFPLKQATEVSFDLLQEMFKRIIKKIKYFIILFADMHLSKFKLLFLKRFFLKN